MVASAVIALIVQILSALVSDAPLISELITLLKGPFNGSRAPTADEWAQLNAILDKAHTALQAPETAA